MLDYITSMTNNDIGMCYEEIKAFVMEEQQNVRQEID